MDISGITAGLPLKVPSLSIPSTGIAGVGDTQDAPAGAGSAVNGFGKALMDAIDGLSQTQNAADDKSVQLAAGDPVDLHEVMLARETASLDFQLAVQVRNKLVEAYQDVMRMQV